MNPVTFLFFFFFFFFQAEDGIRDLVRSRGLGDVYKRQPYNPSSHDEHSRPLPCHYVLLKNAPPDKGSRHSDKRKQHNEQTRPDVVPLHGEGRVTEIRESDREGLEEG
eukprot:TRINITY_DN6710_c0_g1_i1.p2 TRINITY_DN6710_c0_g1~~TRINITY_DN6710_c0_g1_i1.p2  ORF type:complete len:108 (+),score=37.09 TRINITY_DN6710_c0_g1_i1:87-410(+)